MKKLILSILVVLLILSSVLVILFKFKSGGDNSGIEDSRELADILISANSTELSTDDRADILTRFEGNSKLKESIMSYFDSLDTLKDNEVDLTDIIKEYTDSYTASSEELNKAIKTNGHLFTEVDENGNKIDYVPLDSQDYEDSEFIYTRDGRIYSKLGDIDYSDLYFNVTYDGMTHLLPLHLFDKTLEARLTDPSYVFSETDYYISENEDFIDIQYTSIKDPTLVAMVRVYLKNGTLTDFEVTGL